MSGVVIVVAVGGTADRYTPCLRALRDALPTERMVLVPATASTRVDDLAGRFAAEVSTESFASTIRTLRDWPDRTADAGDAFPAHVLGVTAPVLVPDGLLDRALDYVESELRVATVSFFSNNAGLLSIPARNQPSYHALGSHDERSITHSLRAQHPDTGFVSIPHPAGAVHLVSRHALSVCNGLRDDLALSPNGLLTELALRSQRRGFVCAADTGTFVLAPRDLGATDADPFDDPEAHLTLLDEHPFADVADHEARALDDSPTGLVVNCAIAKVVGLRVTIDGRCLGDQEMGTQVQTLALARALAARADVHWLAIATNGNIPAYASDVFAATKVRHELIHGDDFGTIAPADVLHRPYQPDVLLPIPAWRAHARRVLVTLQDLIAYEVGAYASDGATWTDYRWATRRGAEQSDGVIVISEDTRRHVQFERLNVSPDRLFVVPNGTDHLGGTEATSAPSELLRRGFVTERFLVVLGANYGHKNRDLAIRAWQAVRRSHPDVALVLVGAAVPFGSSRVHEAEVAPQADTGLYVLPDVTSAERNWLLHHAEAVVYPTSAEGFGLVPFEAARFGTPTVNVDFGPLAEVNPSGGDGPGTWAGSEFAAAIVELLDDPSLRASRVAATLKSGLEYTWAATAAGLVAAYRDILSRPPNRVG